MHYVGNCLSRIILPDLFANFCAIFTSNRICDSMTSNYGANSLTYQHRTYDETYSDQRKFTRN